MSQEDRSEHAAGADALSHAGTVEAHQSSGTCGGARSVGVCRCSARLKRRRLRRLGRYLWVRLDRRRTATGFRIVARSPYPGRERDVDDASWAWIVISDVYKRRWLLCFSGRPIRLHVQCLGADTTDAGATDEPDISENPPDDLTLIVTATMTVRPRAIAWHPCESWTALKTLSWISDFTVYSIRNSWHGHSGVLEESSGGMARLAQCIVIGGVTTQSGRPSR